MFRVLTANLFNGRAQTSGLDRILGEIEPDIVAGQEVGPNAAEVLGDRFPHGLIRPSLDYTGMALVARQPIEVRRQPLPHRDALVGAGPVTVWSVHLANPVDMPPPWKARKEQVHALKAHVEASTGPLLLVGDLNSTPIWPAYRRLTESLRDGVADWAAAAGTRARATWGYQPWLPAMLRIDHALVRGVAVRNSFTVRVPGSDHRALVVDLEVP